MRGGSGKPAEEEGAGKASQQLTKSKCEEGKERGP
jgi:hypothetical protein